MQDFPVYILFPKYWQPLLLDTVPDWFYKAVVLTERNDMQSHFIQEFYRDINCFIHIYRHT